MPIPKAKFNVWDFVGSIEWVWHIGWKEYIPKKKQTQYPWRIYGIELIEARIDDDGLGELSSFVFVEEKFIEKFE